MSLDTLTQLRTGKLAGATRLDLSCDLTEFPREVFALADTLEVLNLSQNRLTSLPDDLGRLKKLRILFCSDNLFTHLPGVIGQCASLSMVGLKANQIRTIDPAAFPEALRWLILTDNQISDIPPTLARCKLLQKLMLSGNRLQSLPSEMAACENLEMIRLGANQFSTLPDWLFKLPRLTWLALAGNPCSAEPTSQSATVDDIDWSSLKLEAKLGEGASGIIYQALWKPPAPAPSRHVAVKLFKGAMTSDGLPSSEMASSLAVGTHPNLIEVLGRIHQHPDGMPGLVMSLVTPSFANLAGPPSMESCTRDVYSETTRFTLPAVLRMAFGVVSAAAQLHSRGILHGDLYAHNILWQQDGTCLLGDFGAASFYQREAQATPHRLEQMEVRAFACFLEELLTRCAATPDQQTITDALWTIHARCDTPTLSSRPTFAEIKDDLQILQLV